MVESLAQTEDGYLWLGTQAGLFRFDGVRFVQWRPEAGERLPSLEIRSLQAAPNNGLWIATPGGVSRLLAGRLTNFTSATNVHLPAGTIMGMLVDRNGATWIVGASPQGSWLAALRGGSVATYGVDEGLPETPVITMIEAQPSGLLLGTGRKLIHWSPDAGSRYEDRRALAVLSMAYDGEDLLVADRTTHSVLRLSGDSTRVVLDRVGAAPLASRVVYRDREGTTWIGTTGQGLIRVRDKKVERFTRREGLSSDQIQSIFEDRQGNLWIGTANGLDRFSDPSIPRITTLEGLSGDLVTAVLPARNGCVWIGTGSAGLNRVHDGEVVSFGMAEGLPGLTILSLAEDRDGNLWAGGTAGLAISSGGRFTEIRYPDGARAKRVFAMAADPEGTLWMADQGHPLQRVRGTRIEPSGLTGLPPSGDVYQLYCARGGVLWIGYLQGGVAMVSNGAVRVFRPEDGVAPGQVNAIQEDAAGAIWIGTSQGLSRYSGGRWLTWSSRDGLPDGGVNGIIDDGASGMWLATAGGLLHFLNRDLAPAGQGKQVAFSRFGESEGIRLEATGRLANPRLARSKDGILWICTNDGAAFINLAHPRRTVVKPRAIIEQMIEDGRPIQGPASSELSFRGRELRFAFTGTELTSPENAQFRYQLEGFDERWQESTHREAVYTNLGPGRYRFLVSVRDPGGEWSPVEAGLSLFRKPFFYQTWWFAVALLAATVITVWAAHSLRERQLQARFQLVLQERNRLTRELHDTLLQGFAGVVYQLQAASRELDQDLEGSRHKLEAALVRADQSLEEARQTLSFMRLPALEDNRLPYALELAGQQMTDGTNIKVEINMKGEVVMLPYQTEANMFVLAREAIHNAVRHGRPSRISVELTYEPNRLGLVIEDDGVGFDEEVAAKSNRWGLAGMRDRVKQMGGTFALKSAPGKGARIEVGVKFRTPPRATTARSTS